MLLLCGFCFHFGEVFACKYERDVNRKMAFWAKSLHFFKFLRGVWAKILHNSLPSFAPRVVRFGAVYRPLFSAGVNPRPTDHAFLVGRCLGAAVLALLLRFPAGVNPRPTDYAFLVGRCLGAAVFVRCNVHHFGGAAPPPYNGIIDNPY